MTPCLTRRSRDGAGLTDGALEWPDGSILHAACCRLPSIGLAFHLPVVFQRPFSISQVQESTTNRARADGSLEPSANCCAAGSDLSAGRLFTVGGRTFSRRDAIALAMLRGDWFAFEAELRQGPACLRWARERRNESRPTDRLRAAEEFRYSRNLLTAEEMEAWPDDARLPFEEWARYLERAGLRRVWIDRLREILDAQPIVRKETAECLHAEAVCSGGTDG